MAWPPGIADFKAKFVREFVYGDGGNTVMDTDITRALGEVDPYYNQALLNSTDQQTSAYLFIAAHLMVLNIQTAGGLSAVNLGLGVRNVAENFQVSKSLGSASISHEPPPTYVSGSPTLSFLWRTTFGQSYIAMIYHSLIGNFSVVAGPNPNQWNNE